MYDYNLTRLTFLTRVLKQEMYVKRAGLLLKTTIQIDMLPGQRRKMIEQVVINPGALFVSVTQWLFLWIPTTSLLLVGQIWSASKASFGTVQVSHFFDYQKRGISMYY